MGCEREAPECVKCCPDFERIKDGFWGSGQLDKRGRPMIVRGPIVRFDCDRERHMSWDEFGERKGKKDLSGH